MIFRTIKNSDNRYFMMNYHAVDNENLSYKALGILTYLMSKPDGWEANETDISRRHTDGASAVRSGVKELIDAGYMHRVAERDDGGQIIKWALNVYESPYLNPYRQDCDFPHVDKQHVENRNRSKYRDISNTDISMSFSDEKDVPEHVDTEKPLTEQQLYFQRLCWVIGWDHKTITKKNKGQVAQTIGVLKKAGYTADDISRFWSDVWTKDWRYEQKKQRPTLSQVRELIGHLRVDEEKITHTAAAEPETVTVAMGDNPFGWEASA